MKTCSKCGETKALDDFCKDAGTKDGKFRWCRACCKAHRAAYSANNRVELAERRKAKRLADPEAAKARDRESYRKAKAEGRVSLEGNKRRNKKYTAKPEAKEKRHAAAIARRMANPEKYVDKYKSENKAAAERLSDTYIKRQIIRRGKTADIEIPASLIELKRKLILAHRLGKQIKQLATKENA